MGKRYQVVKKMSNNQKSSILTTDDKTNRWNSAYMSLCASYFAAPLVAVRLNYRTVTNSCVFTGHFIQNILHFGTIQILYLFQMNYSYA